MHIVHICYVWYSATHQVKATLVPKGNLKVSLMNPIIKLRRLKWGTWKWTEFVQVLQVLIYYISRRLHVYKYTIKCLTTFIWNRYLIYYKTIWIPMLSASGPWPIVYLLVVQYYISIPCGSVYVEYRLLPTESAYLAPNKN